MCGASNRASTLLSRVTRRALFAPSAAVLCNGSNTPSSGHHPCALSRLRAPKASFNRKPVPARLHRLSAPPMAWNRLKSVPSKKPQKTPACQAYSFLCLSVLLITHRESSRRSRVLLIDKFLDSRLHGSGEWIHKHESNPLDSAWTGFGTAGTGGAKTRAPGRAGPDQSSRHLPFRCSLPGGEVARAPVTANSRTRGRWSDRRGGDRSGRFALRRSSVSSLLGHVRPMRLVPAG